MRQTFHQNKIVVPCFASLPDAPALTGTQNRTHRKKRGDKADRAESSHTAILLEHEDLFTPKACCDGIPGLCLLYWLMHIAFVQKR